jgi:hypothetical protein
LYNILYSMDPIPGIYHHFKEPDQHYEVIGIAFHTETEEDMVVYRPLYEGAIAPLFVRPKAMFLEEVDRPEIPYKGPRFIFIKGSENKA